MKKIVISTMLLTIIFANACTKNNIPTGENIIKYKVNGRQVTSTKKYNNITQSGINFDPNSSNNTFDLNGTSDNEKSGITFIISNQVVLNSKILSNTGIPVYYRYTYNNDYYVVLNGTASIEIKVNTSDILSGNFEGKLYNLNGTQVIDSVLITEGYFDISKN